MNANFEKNGNVMTVTVEGRVDTNTAPALERVIKDNLDGVTALALDFAGVAYISSAGLRVLLSAQKIMNKQGSMVVRNANDDVKEIFDVTGFSDILTVE